jgi:hypothetical protein
LASRRFGDNNDAFEESTMKMRLPLIAAAVLVILAAAPALARHKVHRHCADRPYGFSLMGLLTNPHPQPNGCAPPVYVYGEYVGQDPDPNIRFQLNRDPTTGYAYDLMR